MAAAKTIFICYCHEDESWKDRVAAHLRVLEPFRLLDIWSDRRIAGASDWRPEIEAAMERASVALFLVSKDSLTSAYILKTEIPALLQRRRDSGLRFYPAILSSCAWTLVPWLNGIQAHPRDGKPLEGMTRHEADEALTILTVEIDAALQDEHPRAALVSGPVAAASPRFTGHRINLNFTDGDLREVFKLFADISGLNVVVMPGVAGKATVNLVEVPWDQALFVILRAHGLVYELDDNIITIGRASDLARTR